MTTGDDPQKQLAAALGRIPSGLFIITAAGEAGEMGMLASWVQQCSFRPPLVTLALQPGRPFAQLLMPGVAFVVNVLEAGQKDLLEHFGKGAAPGADAFAGLNARRGPGRPPVLADALAHLECRVTGRHPAGDHDIIVGEVLAGDVRGEGRPMTHVRKNGLHY